MPEVSREAIKCHAGGEGMWNLTEFMHLNKYFHLDYPQIMWAGKRSETYIIIICIPLHKVKCHNIHNNIVII